jgi:predicted small metal-binding protein
VIKSVPELGRFRMADMNVKCSACGTTLTAGTEAELVTKLQDHAKDHHDMEMSEEKAKVAIQQGHT